MNNEKWLPEVGQEFEWRFDKINNWSRNSCIAVTEKSVGFESSSGHIQSLNKSNVHFRPIPTKADVERELLIKIGENSNGILENVRLIQKAGFTIQQKVKRSGVESIIQNNSTMRAWQDEGLVDEMCKLLGDLVEQEQ